MAYQINLLHLQTFDQPHNLDGLEDDLLLQERQRRAIGAHGTQRCSVGQPLSAI